MSGTEGICAQVRERLSALAEGDLPDALRRETEAHLAECAGCAAARARFDQTLAALGDLPRAAPPPDLPDRIDRALDHLRAPSGARSRAPRLRHAVAALLVAGIVVGIIRVIPGTRLPHPLETLDKREPAPAVSDSTETAAPRPRGAGEAPVSRSEPRSAGVRQEAVKKTAPEAPPPCRAQGRGGAGGQGCAGRFQGRGRRGGAETGPRRVSREPGGARRSPDRSDA